MLVPFIKLGGKERLYIVRVMCHHGRKPKQRKKFFLFHLELDPVCTLLELVLKVIETLNRSR